MRNFFRTTGRRRLIPFGTALYLGLWSYSYWDGIRYPLLLFQPPKATVSLPYECPPLWESTLTSPGGLRCTLTAAGLQIVNAPPAVSPPASTMTVVTIPPVARPQAIEPTVPTHLVISNTGTTPVRCQPRETRPDQEPLLLQPGEARIITDATRLVAWSCGPWVEVE